MGYIDLIDIGIFYSELFSFLRMARGFAASHLPKNGVDSTLRRVPHQNVVRAKDRAIPEGDHRSVSRLENDSMPLDKLQRSSAIDMRVHRQAQCNISVAWCARPQFHLLADC
jgi:hypothetical protein